MYIRAGAVAVATSMACIDWLEGLLARLWMPSGEDTPGYRGMPLVILALDTGIAQGERAASTSLQGSPL